MLNLQKVAVRRLFGRVFILLLEFVFVSSVKYHNVRIGGNGKGKADVVDHQLVALDKRVEYRMIDHRERKGGKESAVAQFSLFPHKGDTDADQSGADAVHKSGSKAPA